MFTCYQNLARRFVLCGPPELLPDYAASLAPGVKVSRHIDEAARKADVIMMLRVQKERLAGLKLDVDNYIAHYQLTPERLKLAKIRRHRDASRPHGPRHGNPKRSRRRAQVRD